MNRIEFMSLIYGLLSEREARDVEVAYLLAKKMHKGQVRKELGPDGLPLRYFEHLRRVALNIFQRAGIRSATLIQTALLHDSVEDVEEIQLISLLLQRLFDDEVPYNVRVLSKVPKVGYLDRFRAEIDLCRREERDPGFLVVKMADRLDNLESLPLDQPAFIAKQIRETREDYLPLFEQVANFQDRGLRAGGIILLQEIEAIVAKYN